MLLPISGDTCVWMSWTVKQRAVLGTVMNLPYLNLGMVMAGNTSRLLSCLPIWLRLACLKEDVNVPASLYRKN